MGNERKVTSQTIVIDRTDPVVSVQGVMEGKSYQKEETVAAFVEDENLSAKTAVCEVKDQLGRTVFTPARETENGKKLSYDFSTARLADGSYTLFVQAEDLAGNQTGKKRIVPGEPFRLPLYAFFKDSRNRYDLLHSKCGKSGSDGTEPGISFRKKPSSA